jgi:murein DD-endopeptidase MepM/ murein hydrolase activator NlpD
LAATILESFQTGPVPRHVGSRASKGESDRATPLVHEKGAPRKVEPLIGAPSDTAPTREGTSPVTDADLNYIAARNLLIPVANVSASQLRDTFNQARSEGRQHDAIDIMAPQGTPVLAVTDGAVIRLFQSDRGGITLYELDPSGLYAYYYAHLMRYADGIVEGKPLRRGEVIAYVGDTGNAGAGNYHLHFAISKLTSPKKWSGGDPINPYPLLVRK